MSKIYVGTVGTVFLVETGYSLASASAVALQVTKPSGDTVTWTGTKSTTKIQYTIKEGDLDESGVWKLQSSITSTAWTGLGETTTFTVYDEYT
jgi:hypothetical protein